ncbi:hypothetical protein ACW73L_21510 [Methylolobus aquaticus]
MNAQIEEIRAELANLSDLMQLLGVDATSRDVQALAWTVHNLLESVIGRLDPPPSSEGER